MARRILVAALLLAGCGQPAPEGARLRVTVVGDGERPGGLAQRLVAEATRPGLVARDGAGQLVAGLATSWRFVDDGQGLILRLRPIKWSDGADLVASDVVAAFRRAGTKKEPALAHLGLAGAQAVLAGTARRGRAPSLGVTAPIARVVELRLDSVSPLALAWLAEPGLGLPAGPKGATLANYAVTGTPALRLLRRRGLAATPEARPAVIALGATDDVTAAVADFARGRTDIVMGDGLAGLGEARIAARGEALRIDPLWGVYGYVANGLKGVTVDPRVRQALVLAVDRAALAGRFGLGTITPAASPVPASLGGPAARGGDDRLAVAAALLAEAGWSPTNPLRLVLLLPPGRDHRVVAEQVAADWARLGVLLAVTEVDAAAQDKAMQRGDFDLAVTEASVPVPDAAVLLGRWRCGGPSYCNPQADALVEEARLAPAAARPALLGRAEAALMAAPPLVPLFTPVRWALVARNVEGWTPNRAGSHPLARLAVEGRR